MLLLALSYRYWRARGARVLHAGKWLALLPVLFAVWEGLTAKTAVLPVPFFAPPQALIEVLHDDWPRLLDSLLHSLGLLGLGVLLGTSSGFITGLAIGWSQRIGYWVHPVLRLLGPVPSTALLPLCLFIFPSSFGASVFLIALSTWFPVTVLTWSGVMGIDKAWYDVARTLGASQRFLILRVAIPAALPNVFVGLFMGLGASFSVLIVAEMVGVKSGIGFYLQWAQGWAAYPNMYAALLVMALLCSGLISGLFMLRLFTNDRKIAFDDLVHLLFDERQIFVGQMFRQREVIVETVFNHRPDRDLGFRIQFLDCLSHQVRGRMTNDLKALRVFVSHNRNRTDFGNRVRQVHEFAVNFTCQSSASQAGADRGCNVTYGNR